MTCVTRSSYALSHGEFAQTSATSAAASKTAPLIASVSGKEGVRFVSLRIMMVSDRGSFRKQKKEPLTDSSEIQPCLMRLYLDHAIVAFPGRYTAVIFEGDDTGAARCRMRA